MRKDLSATYKLIIGIVAYLAAVLFTHYPVQCIIGALVFTSLVTGYVNLKSDGRMPNP